MPTNPTRGSSAVVELFGGPRLLHAGEPVPLSPYQTCLLAIVFGSVDERVSRSRIVNLLWEEESGKTRHRLSQLLYSFSKKPGGGLLFQARAKDVGAGVPPCAADLARFEGALDEGAYEVAAGILTRGFLAGLSVVPTRAFEEWMERTRARYRASVRRPVASEWTRLADDEAWGSAAQAATVLLRLDPTDERTLQNVLWSKGMAGRVQEALAEYGTFRERMNAGAERLEPWSPEQETRELVDRLTSLKRLSTAPPEVRDHARDIEPRFFGRAAELAKLARTLADFESPPPVTVLVTGEAGIGKTRLVEEALRGARLRGFQVLRSGSSEFERDIPLNPLLEALDHEATEDALYRLDDPWRSVLLSLMPKFHTGSGPLPEVPYVQPGALPRRTYEAILRLLSKMVLDGPLLIFLDDLQWADETSIAALEFLRRRWNGGRLVLVLALRLTDPSEEDRSQAFARSISLSEKGNHIPLEELDEGSTRALVRHVANEQVAREDQREIAELAGGNPFFTVELTYEYRQGHAAFRVAPREFLPVPVSIRQLLDRRLKGLTTAEREILDILAVYNHAVGLDDVIRLVSSNRQAAATSLDRLQELRLIHWTGNGIQIRHELIRHTVYGSLGPARQAYLHKRVGTWLFEQPSSSPDELALHFDRAGIADRALHFAVCAAERAEASGAIPEALRFLQTALENTSDPEDVAEITGRLGHLHYLHRDFERAAPILEEAANRLRTLDRTADALKTRIEHLDALSRLELLPVQEFIAKAAAIRRDARRLNNWEAVAKLLDVELHALDRLGEVRGVRRVLREAEEVLEKGPPAARCAAASALTLHFFYGSPARALDAAREAMSIARDHDLQEWILKAANRLMVTLQLQGLFESAEAKGTIRLAEDLATKSGDRHLRFGIPLNQGVWYLDIGEHDRARAYFRRASTVVDEHHTPELRAVLNVNLGELEFVTGHIRKALQHFRTALRMVDEGAPVYTTHLATAGIGLCSLRRGKLRAAEQAEESLLKESEEWVFDRFLVTLLRARLNRRRGRRAEAAQVLLDASLAIRSRFVPAWLKLTLERCRIAGTYDPEEALSAAMAGLELSQELGLRERSKQFALVRRRFTSPS